MCTHTHHTHLHRLHIHGAVIQVLGDLWQHMSVRSHATCNDCTNWRVCPVMLVMTSLPWPWLRSQDTYVVCYVSRCVCAVWVLYKGTPVRMCDGYPYSPPYYSSYDVSSLTFRITWSKKMVPAGDALYIRISFMKWFVWSPQVIRTYVVWLAPHQ